MRHIWTPFVAAIICLSGALPSFAGFKVCNDTSVAQRVSISYREEGDWVSEGWWTIQPNGCKLLKSGELNPPHFDLKSRYFYYRATAAGHTFDGENYMFCTESDSYTIIGKEGCQARGYNKESFSEVEIGGGVTEYTLTLVDNSKSQTTAPSAPDTQGDSLGEPFSISGVFQGCDAEGDAYYCAFHGDGWKWYVYEGGGTSVAAMNQLKTLRSGDLADFSGELLSFADASVEAVLHNVSKHGPRNEYENMMAGLQGKWRNTEDPASVMIIYGGESFEYYGSELLEVNHLQFTDTCEGRSGLGPIMFKKTPGDQQVYCYAVLGWDAVSLQLSYIGGAGANDTYYEKIH